MLKLVDIRKSFTKMRGGKLISIESIIIAFFIIFFLMDIKEQSPYLSMLVAVIIGFIFPILVGIFKPLAWIICICFSFFWALFSFIIIGAITNGVVAIGAILAILVFVVSFFIHKNYSGILFRSISVKTNDNKKNIAYQNITKVKVKFCPKCGRKIISNNGKCSVCDE